MIAIIARAEKRYRNVTPATQGAPPESNVFAGPAMLRAERELAENSEILLRDSRPALGELNGDPNADGVQHSV